MLVAHSDLVPNESTVHHHRERGSRLLVIVSIGQCIMVHKQYGFTAETKNPKTSQSTCIMTWFPTLGVKRATLHATQSKK